MGILDSAVLLLQAKNYSGSGEWLDESGNGHHAQFGSTGGADTNDPLFKAYDGTQYIYFPGTADNTIQVTLAVGTIYDYTITYLDATTDTGTATSDGGGVLVLAGTDAGFADKDVRLVDVTADGGGATLALFDAGLATEPFASFTDSKSKVWTINRSVTGSVSTVVDRAMMLFDSDDYLVVADNDGIDFAQGEDFTLIGFGRINDDTPPDSHYFLNKWPTPNNPGYGLLIAEGTGAPTGFVADSSSFFDDVHTLKPVTNVAFIVAVVRNTSDDDIEVFIDGVGTGTPTTDATTGTSANSLDLLIGARNSGAPTDWMQGQIFAVAIWREALSDADVILAGQELTFTPVLVAVASTFVAAVAKTFTRVLAIAVVSTLTAAVTRSAETSRHSYSGSFIRSITIASRARSFRPHRRHRIDLGGPPCREVGR